MKENRKPLSKRVRFEVFKRDGFKCRYCGKTSESVMLEVDHVFPVSKGGTDEPGNLVTACFDCNRGKANKPLSQIVQDDDERMAIEQQRRESEFNAKQIEEIKKSIISMRASVLEFIQDAASFSYVSERTLNCMVNYVKRYGPTVVFPIISRALVRARNEEHMGIYVTKVIKLKIQEGEISNA